MEVTSTLNLSAEDQKELTKILGCPTNKLGETLSAHASAALEEYVTMFLGQKVFRRGSDQLEYRLFLLIEKAFGNKIPDEQEVSRLFQTTASESRSLIRSVMSKYQYQLKTAIDQSMKYVLKTAKQSQQGGSFTVIINSTNIVAEFNRVLADIDGKLKPVSKKRGSVSTYEIAPSSYTRLCQRLGVKS